VTGAVSTKRRIIALWFPRLQTDRLQRRQTRAKAPPDDSPPLVIAAKTGGALKLAAVDRKATAQGLERGMTLADARAMLPALSVKAANETADHALLEAIAEWCDRFTPFVALLPPQSLVLDVTGAAHLFGGERAMLDLMRVSLAKQGFAIRGALAGTAGAARALAHYRDGTIVAAGEEAAAVASLPVEGLGLDAAATQAFRRAGLKTIGQIAARKRSELMARFGSAMVTALDRVLGRVENPISPRLPLPDIMAEHRFADPVVSEELVMATLDALAQSLAPVLAQRGEGARALEAAFFRADGHVRRIAIETARPVRTHEIIGRLFREKLAQLADPLDAGFGFDLIRLAATRAERSEAETVSLDAGANEDKEIAFLVDRLAARFGAQRIVCFQPNDTHIPEAAAVTQPAQYAKTGNAAWARIRKDAEAPRRPLRLFAKPEPIDATAEVPEGPPGRFCWRRVQHLVTHASGPERIAMEWWRHHEPRPTRDYFRVEDSEGRRFWLYREGLYGRETAETRWFVHGLFA
jgi:protein ImuB